MGDLTSYEIDALEILAGEREFKWGAWLSACLEHLSSLGLCTHGPNYKITDAGRAHRRALAAALAPYGGLEAIKRLEEGK